jgi:hypothetical protein
MPFRDPEWEELQRDCDIFPAYTDYLYGPDTRLHVTQEPGLHPQIYPAHQWQAYSAPIRYTNSMPSRTWSCQMADGVERPANAAVRCESYGQDLLRAQGLSREGSRRSTMGFDVRSQMGSPAPQFLPPQGVRTVTKEEMARRKILDASQQRPMPAPSTNSPQQPVRMTRQQTQARNAPTPSSIPAARPSKPSFLRSSSTTDVDEHVARMASPRKNRMLQPTASPSPMTAQPAHHPSQNGLTLPPNPYLVTNPAAPTPVPTTPQNPPGQIPILQPSDMVDNPRYSCIEVNKRKYIHRLLFERWNIVDKATDHAKRAKIIAEIQHISFLVHKSLPNLEGVAQTQGKRQAQLTQETPAHQMLHLGQLQQSYAHSPPFLGPSPSPSLRQLAQQPQYHPLQPSPGRQPQLPHYSPLRRAAQQHHYTPHLNPQPPQTQAQPPELRAYQHQPQQMHQHQQQDQPPSHYSNPPQAQAQQQQPQTAPQILHFPPSNMSHTQASPSKPISPEALAQLRANIDAHIPQVWQCLQLQLGDQQYQPTDPGLVQQKQQARAWLNSFKKSLPAEAHGYMQYIVSRMCGAVQQGRDPLAAAGMKPLE